MESVISSSNENPGQIQILQDSTHIFNRHSAIDIAPISYFTTLIGPRLTYKRGPTTKIFGGIAYG